MTIRTHAVLVASFLAANAAVAGDGSEHAAHDAGVDHRGDHAMGFSHEKTAHHFALTKTGGVILAATTDPKDKESRDVIVRHFRHIASAFKKGEFDMPMFIHDRVPPGVPEMKRLAGEIEYRVEELPTGGRVIVTTKNPEALRAIHEFLKFQIEDHHTGDTTAVRP